MKGDLNIVENNQGGQGVVGIPEVVYSPRAKAQFEHRNEREHLMAKYVDLMETPPATA